MMSFSLCATKSSGIIIYIGDNHNNGKCFTIHIFMPLCFKLEDKKEPAEFDVVATNWVRIFLI